MMNMIRVLPLQFLIVSLILLTASASTINSDQEALFAMKDHITHDPTNFFAQNWNPNTSLCNWKGITCDLHSHRVTALNISGLNLQGTIPSQLGNLSSLQTLDLSHNKLSGSIPSSIFTISELKLLSLRENQLSGSFPSYFTFNVSSSSLADIDFNYNNLSSELPANICKNLPFLEILFLAKNNFHGQIPSALSMCKHLKVLSLTFNDFSGAIPKEFGNFTKLEELYLGNNRLQGEIPQEISNLKNLVRLRLDNNELVGAVPATIFNISTLKILGVTNNTFSGNIPSSANVQVSNLEKLYFLSNNFSGPIPSFIFNLSKLSILELADNLFSGFIPNTFGNLRNLEWLGLDDNFLISSTPRLSFLSSLTNCKNLRLIDLSSNQLSGILPRSIGNLSVSLEKFIMISCNISGSIPKEISNLTNLITIYFGDNKLNGSIPVTLNRLQKLQGLSFRDNKLTGSIPYDLCKLASVFMLNLGGNKLSGSIPACFGNLTSLRILSLGSNELNSEIPSNFWNLKDILHLNFSSNFLTGSLPFEIGKLKAVVEIYLSRNNLSGVIPGTIGELKNLQFLSLDDNRFHGSIPESFGELTSLVSLDLSDNNLSGIIPLSLEKLVYLEFLNLSFNRLEGEIPRGGPFANFSSESFVGNDLLCGLPYLQHSPCKSNQTSTHEKSKKKALLLGIVLSLSTALIIVVTLAFRFGLISRCQKRATKEPNDANMSPQATIRRFSYLELLRATDGFSENNLIGRGSFGSVYKARLQDEMEVAVKVFHLQFERASKSFEVECEVMKNIRHRNLVKIISSCTNEDFKALVLEYMVNGSLEKYLYSSNCILDIFQRLNIMIDVASALEYLHFGYSAPIIHCDLKPSNVLLDDNMVAHLGDFGIAKLLIGEDQSIANTQTLATIGYMAPEYGREGQVSTKGDVYSYGIMLMETFTGKSPTDEIFDGEMNLKRWVDDLLHISVMEVVDANLLSREDQHYATKEQCVSSLLNIALECTDESPEKRINAKEIVTRLLKVRVTLRADVEGRSTRRNHI